MSQESVISIRLQLLWSLPSCGLEVSPSTGRAVPWFLKDSAENPGGSSWGCFILNYCLCFSCLPLFPSPLRLVAACPCSLDSGRGWETRPFFDKREVRDTEGFCARQAPRFLGFRRDEETGRWECFTAEVLG